MYITKRNELAGMNLQRLDFDQEQLEQQIKAAIVEYNMFDLDPEVPIYRITPAEHVLKDLERATLTLTRINKTNWDDVEENPALGWSFTTDRGEQVSLATTQNIFGQCWSIRPLGGKDDWHDFGHGRPAVRLETTPRKLLAGIIDPKNRYSRLQHWIGAMTYETLPAIASRISDPAFLEFLDTTGAKAMLTLLRLRESLNTEEEARLLFDYFAENEWDKENVQLEEPRASVRFEWTGVVAGLLPEPGLARATLKAIQALI